MKSLLLQIKWAPLLAIIILFTGCKQPETIVVDEAPTVSAQDTTQQNQGPGNQASFRQLVIGEYNEIKSLDPLFAQSATEMRAIQLVYEGLVRFDENGNLVPGMARDWSASDDSLEYTFQLRNDVFYHDSEVFSTGTGRRINSQDVKFAFERMARAGVPPRAAHMFMDIRGFNSYFQEQRHVYNPENRQLDGISGIQTPNDSTVVFELESRDSNFLKKLATPLAVIYPQEAVGNTVQSFSAVGTGPFIFSEGPSDSTLIFSKFQNYYDASDVELNRIDIQTISSESDLFKSMGAGDIHLLPQLGPQLMQSVLNNNGDLLQSYSNRYILQKTQGTSEFAMRYNPNSNLSASVAQQIGGLIQTDSGSYFARFPGNIVEAQSNPDSLQSDTTSINQQFYTVYSDDPFVRTFLGSLSNTLSKQNAKLQMMNIQAPSRNTGLFFTQHFPLIPDAQWMDYKPLFSFKVRQVALQRTEINGLNFNQYPWWFNPRSITLPAIENL